MVAGRAEASALPTLPGFDSTRALLREGHAFIARRCRELGAPGFRTRLALRPVVCLSGIAAAREFYEADRFARTRALPSRALALLQGADGAQRLDGDAHRDREALIVALVGREGTARLVDAMERCFLAAREDWQRAGHVALLPAMERVLTAAVCRWSGIALGAGELDARCRELAARLEDAKGFGPRVLRGATLQSRSERWARRQIDAVRSMAPGTRAEDPLRLFALHRIAMHRDADGARLDRRAAATELLDLLRPTVAAARFAVFAAHALELHPSSRAPLRDGDAAYARAFAQELRRLYPFHPMASPLVGGRVLRPFAFAGHAFASGDRVVLDVWGTHRDPAHWRDAETFRPERFLDGGADERDVVTGGRPCPGEALTVALVARAALLLAQLDYRVAAGDRTRGPAAPPDGLRLERVSVSARAREPALAAL